MSQIKVNASSRAVEMTVIGKTCIEVTGKGYTGAVRADGRCQLSVHGNRTLEVEHFARLKIEGQARVIVYFEAAGAFVMEEPRRIRVVSTGGGCVNLLCTETCEACCSGPGLVYAEGIDTQVCDCHEVLVAVDCPSARATGDGGSLLAIGCEEVRASDNSAISALACETVVAVQMSSVHARDCERVYVDEGFDDLKPVTHLTDCESTTPVQQSYEYFDGLPEVVYETVDGEAV